MMHYAIRAAAASIECLSVDAHCFSHTGRSRIPLTAETRKDICSHPLVIGSAPRPNDAVQFDAFVL